MPVFWDLVHDLRLVIVVLLLLVACATPPILNPDPGAYPCGVDGVVCLTPEGNRSGFCCSQNEVCGGEQPNTPVTCPVGMCCFSGSANDLFAKRPPTKQRKVRP